MDRQRILEFFKRVPPKIWAVGGASLVVVVLGVLCFPGSRAAKESARSGPATARSVSGWRVELLNTQSSEWAANFGAIHAPGKPLFVPADTDLAVVAEPASSAGEFRDGSAQRTWSQFAGRIDPAVPGAEGTRQLMRTPSAPGLYRLEWTENAATPASAPAYANAVAAARNDGGTPEVLEVLVMARAEFETRGEKTLVKVNGKAIGGYLNPATSPTRRVREHADQYQPPKFFAQLTPEAAKLRLGPDFELGQLIAFMDHRGPDGKKVYTTERHTDVLPLRMDLIEKLIKLRERLRQKGVRITKFAVTSGFRTPEYNRQIKGALFSRHCYGDAVDIYIDENDNHRMDDLNGDGRVDRKDGLVIANACRELELEGAVVPGGIGVYEWHGEDSVRSHVHIDCRGYISRWGQVESGPAKRMFKWWPAEEFQEEEGGE